MPQTPARTTGVTDVKRADLAERRRSEIVRAALALFAERGYHATGIADIAAELGMGHGTFYRYFRNKRDIVSHVLVHVMERLNDVVSGEQSDGAASLEEYQGQLARIGDKLFALFTDDPQLAQFVFVESFAVDRDFSRAMVAGINRFGGLTQAYLNNGVERGFLRTDLDTRVTARAINGIILAAAIDAFDKLSAADPATEPDALAATRDRWLPAATALILHGVVRPEVRPETPQA
jgi:AcrR family transcriptional regulator